MWVQNWLERAEEAACSVVYWGIVSFMAVRCPRLTALALYEYARELIEEREEV